MQSTRPTRMLSIFYSVLLLNSARTEVGRGLQVVPACTLLKNYSFAWPCLLMVPLITHQRLQLLRGAEVELLWGSASQSPELWEISFGTTDTERCTSGMQRVCAKRFWLRVVFWGLFLFLPSPLLLGVRLLSLRFGVQVLMQPFCLGMLQIEHLDCKLNKKKWLDCKTKEVARWQIYNEMFWWINAL